MPTIRNQISTFINLYIALPVGVLLLLINFQLWTSMSTELDDSISHLVDDSVAAVNSMIWKNIEQANAAVDPDQVQALLSLFGVNKPTGETSKGGWSLEEWYENIVKLAPDRGDARSASDEERRLAETNPVSEKLKSLSTASPPIGRMLVSDILGDIRATNFKPAKMHVGTEDWWRETLKTGKGKYLFKGLDDEGRFWISRSIYSDNQPAPIGVLRFEILLEGIASSFSQELPYPKAGFALRGSGEEFYFTAGDPNTIENYADKTVRHVIVRYQEAGWRNGVRYKQLLLDEAFEMDNRPRLLAFIEEPLTPPEHLTKIGLSSFASVLFLVFVSVLARKAGNRLGEGTTEILAAGNLLIHRMKNEAGGPQVPQSIRGPKFREVEKRFSDWLNGFRQSILDNVETHQFETERDQELARDFQLAYLHRSFEPIPSHASPGRLKLRFHHQYQPALALGGDFFEISKLAPDVGGIFVSDVMGHGTRSALITSSLRTLIHDNLAQARNARLFMAEINKGFCNLLAAVKLRHPLFASAYYFVADTTARAATFSTAGHPAPFHINRSGNTVSRLVVSEPHGAALGITPGEEYTGGSCRLTAGDVFIFFTDGVYEAFNAYGQEFGMDQLEKTLKSLMHHSLQDIVDGVLAAVEDFTGNEPLQDDICILGMEVVEG